jgi:hypothetical protein
MIEKCNNDLADWADDGLHFIVKDPARFASDIIPQYLKHDNFSCFVRQLHFYGFRKIKLDPIKINLKDVEQEARYWRFKHSKFRRGRADLLCEVRIGSNQEECLEVQDLESTKAEVSSLKSQVASLTSELRSLVAVVREAVAEKYGLRGKRDFQPNEISPLNKRQRLTTMPDNSLFSVHAPVPEMNFCHHRGLPPLSTRCATIKEMMPLGQEGITSSFGIFNPRGSTNSCASLSSIHTARFLEAANFETISPDPSANDRHTGSSVTPPHSGMGIDEDMNHDSQGAISPDVMSKLQHALSALPNHLQQSLVDKVVSAVTTYQRQADQVTPV